MRSTLVLVRKHVLHHWVRSGLTMAALTLALFLLCFVVSIVTTLNAAVTSAASTRLVVQSAVSLFVNLPLAYQEKIAGVPGVEAVTTFQWFGGYYQENEQMFAQFGVDHDRFFDMYAKDVRLLEGPDGTTGEAAAEAVVAAMAADRRACVIGDRLAEEKGWEVGDTVPLLARIFTKSDGSAWDFNVVGIYEPLKANVDDRTLFFRYDYLKETIVSEGVPEDQFGTGVYMVNLTDSADPAAVSEAIDGFFENGPQRTQTTTEAAFQSIFVAMLGNVPVFMGSIGGAIVFAVMFSVVNTMLMAARQRRGEAGILKALGFSNGVVARLLVAESLFLCLLGGGAGIALALLSQEPVRDILGANLPGYAVEWSTVGLAAGVTVALGLLAGVAPAVGMSRLPPAEALRSEG